MQSLTRSLPQRETQQDNLCPTGKRTAALFLCWLLSPPWAAVSRDMFGHIHHLCLQLCNHYINAILYIYMYIQHVAMKGQSSANSVQDTLTGIHKAPCLARLLHVEATNTFRNSKDGQLIVDVVHCYPIYPNRTLIFIYIYGFHAMLLSIPNVGNIILLYNDTQVNGNIINPYFSDGIWIPK